MISEKKTYSKEDAEEKIENLRGWNVTKEGVTKEFEFKNYSETYFFVNSVAWLAQKMDHHPDISFGYKNCRVSFKTHSENGITEKDIEGAKKLEELINIPK